MSNLLLKVGVWAGTDINTACNEAVNLANSLGIGVEFDFNGIKCFAYPGDDPRRVIDAWHREWESTHRHGVRPIVVSKDPAIGTTTQTDSGVSI